MGCYCSHLDICEFILWPLHNASILTYIQTAGFGYGWGPASWVSKFFKYSCYYCCCLLERKTMLIVIWPDSCF